MHMTIDLQLGGQSRRVAGLAVGFARERQEGAGLEGRSAGLPLQKRRSKPTHCAREAAGVELLAEGLEDLALEGLAAGRALGRVDAVVAAVAVSAQVSSS